MFQIFYKYTFFFYIGKKIVILHPKNTNVNDKKIKETHWK